ncbi:uncharacterized protein LOC130184164 [Seriola aureovittata]|uniref:uncharacterized protein LOC130184164 n=1 Tax=Seriola aureovittata TaxID=2871759 RepID=UPI0024BE2A41|nr:uncharacterized protein LOC130184164 [Seriola aureovittata]
MAGLTWILTFLCVAGCHHSSASPFPRSPRMVQVGENVTLTCNLTSSMKTTWYLLRSDQLLPLLTVTPSKIGENLVSFHSKNNSRIYSRGDMERGPVSLEILEVEEKDAGLYFCTGWCAGVVCVNRGVLLTVNGADGELAIDKMRQPCWRLGICALPALIALVFVFLFGLCLCSGKPAVCCCPSLRRDSSLRITEDMSLHYSSLKHAHEPRPSGHRGTRLVKEDVTYSTVMSRKNPNTSH